MRGSRSLPAESVSGGLTGAPRWFRKLAPSEAFHRTRQGGQWVGVGTHIPVLSDHRGPLLTWHRGDRAQGQNCGSCFPAQPRGAGRGPRERGVAPPPTPPAEGPSHRGTGGARSRRPVAGTPGHGWRRLGCSLGHTSTGPLSPVGCR